MADTVKRLNYFDHQFLRRQDFADEQAYHLAQRRTHNRLLHTPGVAGGMEVKPAPGGRQVIVGEGVAVDAQGREIVLAADSAPLDLAPYTGKTVYVTIAYAEREIDPSAETGVQGNRRVEEAPDVQIATDPPADAGLTLVLGRVKVDKDGAGTVDAGEGAGRRRAAGAGGGEGEVRQLTFASDAVAAAQWPSMRMSKASTVEVRGSLSVTEDTFTGGKMGVGTTTPEAKLQVVNAATDSNGTTLVLGPVGGSNLRLGYHADYSWIQSHGLKPLRINEISNDVIINRAGNARVGVGIDPRAQLHVSRALAVGPLALSDAPGRVDISGAVGELSLMDRAVTQFGGKAGERFVWYVNEKRLRAWTEQTGDLLNLSPDGKLTFGAAAGPQQLNVTQGIGFANQNANDKRLWSPADGLLRWQTHNSAGAHAFEVGHQGDAAAVHLDTAGPSWLTGGALGIGLANPGAQLHVAASVTLGPTPMGDAVGRLHLSGPVAELSLQDRGTAKYNGKEGDRFVVYANEKRLRVWTEERGDLLNVSSDGRLSFGGGAGPQQLNVTGGIGFANQNANDKRLWSPADGLLRWQTHNSAGAHAFEVGHQADAAAVHLDTRGPSWLTGGSLGIGRTNPAAALHIEGKDALLWLQSPDPGVRALFTTENGAVNWDYGIGGGRAGARDYWIGDGRSVLLTLTYGEGRLGLGTNAPESKLHVKGDAKIDGNLIVNGKAVDTSGGGGTQWGNISGGINYNGKVGINQPNPTRVLHVKGADALGVWESTGSHAYFALSTAEGWDNRVEVVNRPGGRLCLWTAGANDVLNITRDGKFGFKTTTPSHEFHVSTNDGAIALFETRGGNSAALRVCTNEGMDNRTEFCCRPGGRLALWVAGASDAFNITRDGKFGFKTTAPSHEFHVYTNDGAVALFETKQNNAFFRISTSEGIDKRVEVCNRPGGRMAFWTSFDAMSILRTGRVGIGTEAPDARLQVLNAAQDSNGDTLIVGPVNSANLRMGYHADYSWIQSHGAKPLRINELGNNVIINRNGGAVGVGVDPQVQLHVRSQIACGPFVRAGVCEGRIEASGPCAEIAFHKRQLTSWPANPVAGDRFLWYNDGGVARFWTEAKGDIMWIDGAGNVTTAGRLTANGGKVGYVVDHFVNATGDALEEGDVVVVSGTQPVSFYGIRGNVPVPEVDLTDVAGDPRVCGIVAHVDDAEAEVAAINAEVTAAAEEETPAATKRRAKAAAKAAKAAFDPRRIEKGQQGSMVTLGAFSHCKVDAQYGAIAPGDLLMASPTRGHAQKVTDRAGAVGAIVGKALAAHDKGTGKIPVMVLLQ